VRLRGSHADERQHTVTRLFFAIALPDAVRRELDGSLESIRGRIGNEIRWTPTHQLHVTLRFLGDVDAHRIPGLREAARAAVGARDPFRLSFAGLGAFPNLRRPKVIWLGVKPVPALVEVRAAVEEAVVSAGLERDARPFRPHVTLGRVRRTASAPAPFSGRGFDLVFGQTVRVDRVALVESVLGRGGATHAPVAEFPLGRRR